MKITVVCVVVCILRRVKEEVSERQILSSKSFKQSISYRQHSSNDPNLLNIFLDVAHLDSPIHFPRLTSSGEKSIMITYIDLRSSIRSDEVVPTARHCQIMPWPHFLMSRPPVDSALPA